MNRTAVLADIRRRSPLLAACGILFLSSCSSQPSRRSQSPEPQGRPNILIISLDDMNDWIGPMGGHPQARTPHLDAFAKSALTFRRAYTPSPSCNPARTALFSGKAPWVTGLYNNPQTWRHVVGDELMIIAHHCR